MDVRDSDATQEQHGDDVRTRWLEPGQIVLDRYIVDKQVSSGAHGAVFRGHTRVTLRPVALKVEHRDNSETDHARFAQEALILAKIVDRNVVKVLDAGMLEDGGALLVMELLEGPTLRAMIERRCGWLPWREAVRLNVGVLRGVAAAHRAGVIHRDIKPSNVVVVYEGSEQVAKVIDFGVAKHDSDSGFVALTVAGEVLGTLNYMAPEQLTGDPAQNVSDIYAIGVTLYECLTGALPYSGKGMRAAMAKVCGTPPAPMHPPVGAELWPARLSALVLQALHPDPTQRPPSADALADELEACLGESADVDAARARELVIPKGTSVEFVAMALPAGSLSSAAELEFIVHLLRGTARPFIVGPDAVGALLLRGGTGESASVVDAIVRAFRQRYGEIVVARERLEAGDSQWSERSVSDAAGRLAKRLSVPPPPPAQTSR